MPSFERPQPDCRRCSCNLLCRLPTKSTSYMPKRPTNQCSPSSCLMASMATGSETRTQRTC
ncbi:hypothetical protein EMPG_15280 [Blastomyces silverae]|uniref:Uncharacterized protein n=1 Tax=Blastomyces silverae TaxID=2060906 RepID=A0A0H1BJJ4_9EURO|nr:hypothetical protein EMPG_15280 [Blastomyces silverae]